MTHLKNNIAAFLYKVGVTANAATWLGLVAAFGAGFLIYEGLFFYAALALLVSGTFDLLDGAIARVSGTSSALGGILDSTLDRYGDAFVFGGFLFFYGMQQQTLYALFAFSAYAGSFVISYVRARAECEVDHCRVGFWERGERTVYLVLGLLLNNAPTVLLVLAIGTHGTALARFLEGKRLVSGEVTSAEKPSPAASILCHRGSRKTPVYLVKAALLVLLAVFWRLDFTHF